MSILEGELSSVSIDRWFRNLTPREIAGETLLVDVPDEFFKNWIQDHYSEHITQALLKSQTGLKRFELKIVPRHQQKPSQPTNGSATVVETPSTAAFTSTPRPKPTLNQQYTFNEFVVGPSNRFAHAASLAVAEQPAKIYNPLFIYGPVGLGKTHLMQALGHQVYAKNPEANVLYITSEKFTNELITAIQNQKTLAFREKYRNVDILLIDDVHFIAGKEATQEEFFHTFNALYDSHKQIVVSSDRPPKDIINLEERLVSRFEWGLVTDIQRPDFETRSAILRKKAERHNLPVPDEVTNFIAETIQSNIRELEGSLMRVVAYSQLIGRPITQELAQEVLQKAIQESGKKITVDVIQKNVAAYFSIRISEMTAKRRSKNVVLPRQVAMYLARDLTDFSLPEIGGFFGGRDHTTIMHACDKIRTLVERDRSLKEAVERIRQGLHG